VAASPVSQQFAPRPQDLVNPFDAQAGNDLSDIQTGRSTPSIGAAANLPNPHATGAMQSIDNVTAWRDRGSELHSVPLPWSRHTKGSWLMPGMSAQG